MRAQPYLPALNGSGRRLRRSHQGMGLSDACGIFHLSVPVCLTALRLGLRSGLPLIALDHAPSGAT